MDVGPRREALMTRLAEKPGAAASPVIAPRGRTPVATVYKVVDKMFAIVGLGKVEHVILKCDPHLVEVLRETYAGVGHRSHLDRRYWISVELQADVPAEEIDRLVDQSYDLVCASLTRKQRAELAARGS
ncbi:MAG: MmcQ/YjbR family DNA-binding protein [Caulobacteraceae bacterium]|jgi:predicted DNA-binding protein (MmcQ/YjbR family)